MYLIQFRQLIRLTWWDLRCPRKLQISLQRSERRAWDGRDTSSSGEQWPPARVMVITSSSATPLCLSPSSPHPVSHFSHFIIISPTKQKPDEKQTDRQTLESSPPICLLAANQKDKQHKIKKRRKAQPRRQEVHSQMSSTDMPITTTPRCIG